MGRIGKLKRQAMQEANKRNLGLIKEQEPTQSKNIFNTPGKGEVVKKALETVKYANQKLANLYHQFEEYVETGEAEKDIKQLDVEIQKAMKDMAQAWQEPEVREEILTSIEMPPLDPMEWEEETVEKASLPNNLKSF